MILKTENGEIWIGMTKTEATWINEELEGIDTENSGLVGLDRLKYMIWAGFYIDK